MKKYNGFTLIELLVVIAILGTLAVLAAPSFGRMLERNQMRTLAADWRSAFYLAQTEAIRTKQPIRLCASIDGQSCTANNNFTQGWIVIDTQSNQVIQDYPPTTSQNINVNLNIANGLTLTFLNNGRLPSNFAGANLQLTSSRYSDLSMRLDISRAGRIQ